MLNENIKNLRKGKRIIARRTCRKTECSKADGIEMGKRSIGS